MKILRAYNCMVDLIQGELHTCPLNNDGVPNVYQPQFDWKKVNSSVTQDFLNAANEVLGTCFKVGDFQNANQMFKIFYQE